MTKFLIAAACFAAGLATSAQANDSPWQVRGRLLGVFPDESASITPIGGVCFIAGWVCLAVAAARGA